MLLGARDQERQVHGLLVQRLPFHAVAEDADGDEEVLHPPALDVGDGHVLADARRDDVFAVQHRVLELLEVDHVPRIVGKRDELGQGILLVPRLEERDPLARDVVF